MSRSRVVNLANFEQFTAINVLSDPGLVPGKKVVPNVATIRVSFVLDDAKIGNLILHGRYAGNFAGTQAQANAIMTGLTTGATWTALAAFFSTSTSLGGVGIRDINSPDNAEIVSNNAAVPGTSASAALPVETALCVTLKTSKVGPGNRGRFYLPGFATNALATGNVVAPAVITAVNNWANIIPTTFAAQGYTFVLAQPERKAYTGTTGTQHPARLATSANILTQTVRDNHWDSQRRRGLK